MGRKWTESPSISFHSLEVSESGTFCAVPQFSGSLPALYDVCVPAYPSISGILFSVCHEPGSAGARFHLYTWSRRGCRESGVQTQTPVCCTTEAMLFFQLPYLIDGTLQAHPEQRHPSLHSSCQAQHV